MALDDGYALARITRSLAVHKKNVMGARIYAQKQWPADDLIHRVFEKAASGVIDIAALGDDADVKAVSAGFLVLAKRTSLISILDNVSPFPKVPYAVPVMLDTGGALAYWTPEAMRMTTTTEGLKSIRLHPLKLTATTVVTQEFGKLVGPEADALLTRALQRAVNKKEGTSFVDPSNAGIAGTEPAAITYGATEVVSTGGTPAAISADLANLFAAFDGDLSTSVIVMSPGLAVSLALLGAAVGAANLGIGSVGYLAGVPAVAHNSVPPGLIVLIDTAGVALGERTVTTDATADADVAVDDGTGTGTATLVSTFQSNYYGLKLYQYENWLRLTDGAVAYLSGCFPAVTAPAA